MGVHAYIVKLLKLICPEAWSHLRADGDKYIIKLFALWRRDGLSLVEDCMLRMNKIWSPRSNHTFTGLELLEGFCKALEESIQTHNSLIYVCNFDDPLNIPPPKWATQKKRSWRNKSEAYHDSSLFLDEGIQEPGKPAELFDIRRLLATRRLRSAVWVYFMTNIHRAKYFASRQLDKRLKIIFNYNQHGPYLLKVNPLSGEFDPPLGLPQYAHDHGETDITLFYWMNKHFKDRHTLLKTFDSDIYPCFFEQGRYRQEMCVEDEGTITLQTQDGAKHKVVFVDMRYLRQYSLSRLRMTSTSFSMLCILNGTDYVRKDQSTHYVKPEAVQAGVEKFNKEITSVWGDPLPDPENSAAVEQAAKRRMGSLKRLLFSIYWDYVPAVKTLVKEEMKRSGFPKDLPSKWDELYEALAPVVAYSIQQAKVEKEQKDTTKKRKSREETEQDLEQDDPRGTSKRQKRSENDTPQTDSSQLSITAMFQAKSVQNQASSDTGAVQKKEKKRSTTSLRPPNPSTLSGLAELIKWNICYWRGEYNPVLKKMYFP